MGSSKIILLSGVYLILGFYTLSFTTIDESNYSNALLVSSSVQADQLAKTGLSISQQKMGANINKHTMAPQTVSVSGGTVTYLANPAGCPASHTKVISTANYNGHSVTVSALYQYTGGRWRLLKVYTTSVS